nr:hypothetical protein [Tanacetum cinerariifolium]
MDDDMAPDAQVHSSDDEDIENAHVPKTGDMAMFIDWFCKRQGITKLKPRDLEGPVFELVKVFHLNVIHLQYQMEECHKLLTDSVDDSIIMHNVNNPLPLGGPPAHKKKKKRRDSPKTPPGSPPHQPPPLPPPAGPSGTSGSPRASRSLGASGSLQVLPPPSSTNQ